MMELMFQWPVESAAFGGLFVGVMTYFVQGINFGKPVKKPAITTRAATSTYLVWEGNHDNK